MQIQKWLKQGVFRPSNSTYAAPAFIVEQPFHESTPRRVVIDYSGKCYISKMDVKSAFNTIRIRETDIFKTGFVTPDGHYEFLRMPFGVTNGPSTMTRAIKLAYEHLSPHNVNTYIDDISTSHDDFSYHLKVLYKILEATRNAGFKLTPGKTQLTVSEIALFGRILSQDGERPDPDRTASVQRYSTLKSIHEVRSFLGFANQFRKHIQNYAVIAKPLTSVLKGLERKTSNATIILTDDQQRTFETLKTAIATAPILAYFKQGLPTFLETDASYSGLGAVLSQDQNGKRRVIEYASRTLKDAETRYHSNELECTAVHWALTEKFRLYLLGHKFQLITDNYTTAYVVAKSAVNRKFARYLVDLAQFDFTTVHRPGKQNVIADHLSRFPTPSVCLTLTASHQSEICTKQKQDDFCQYFFRLLKEQNPNKKTKSIISNYNIDNNTLVRVKEKSKYFAVVKAVREQTLIACHDDVGHMDAKKTLDNLKQRYWWPNMRKDCKNYVRSCI
ncbi:retrovirus-related Pol polyprotein from transposon opus [Trichonephila clavipes]|nr:retrovirus-related Pol polyprotein from transposon opus [Trichonephila clavipes]